MSRYFGAVDYVVVISMLVISSLIGLFFAWKDRKNTNEDEYLRGGKHMSVIPVAVSIMASFLPGVEVLGFPTYVYFTGSQYFAILLPAIFGAIIANELFIPVYYNMNLTSVNEYLLKRFDSRMVQIVANISMLISWLPFFGVEMLAPSIALSIVTDLSITASIFVIGGIVTFYATMGGLKGVIWVDLFQFGIMVFGMVSVCVRGANVSGGMAEVWKRAYLGGRVEFWNMDFDLYQINSFWVYIFGGTIIYAGAFAVSQIQIQRAVCMPTLANAKKALYIAIPGFMCFYSIVILSGIIMYAKYYDCEPMLTGRVTRPDQLMPYFVLDIFENDYKGLPGLYVAAIFGSALSTLSSGINAMSSIVWEDYAKKMFSRFPNRYNPLATRGLSLLVGVISIGLAFAFKASDNVVEAAIGVYGASIGPMFSVFLLGIFFPWTNRWGAAAALIISQGISYWSVIGWVADKRPPESAMLGLSTEGCAAKNITVLVEGSPLSMLTNYKIPEYNPKGLGWVHHLNPFAVPITGLIVAFFIGNVVSLLTFANRDTPIDPNLVHFKICYYLEWLLPRSWRQLQDKKPRKMAIEAKERFAGSPPVSRKSFGDLDNGTHFEFGVQSEDPEEDLPSEKLNASLVELNKSSPL